MSRLQQQLTLPDGRRLGYDEHGEPSGHPLFYFHGTPSARVEWDVFGMNELAYSLDLRVIAVDRPGMGLSDYQPDRRMSDWPADVSTLADYLGLDRFAVLGYSGGVPYAAACAAMIPERLTRVGLAAVVGPFDQPHLTAGINAQNLRFLYINRDRPRLARVIQRGMALVARFAPDRLVAQATAALPTPDQAVMADPRAGAAFTRMVRESARRGARGPQLDSALMVSPWDFSPADIRIPVYLWHGARDQNASRAMAEYLAAAIADSHLTVYPDDGHLSVMAHHAEEILRTLTQAEAHR
jgi:pimeloyl-ACP methyl ester carboxylesterase